MEEKKDNNNNFEKVTSFQERSQVLVTTQETLFGDVIIKPQFKLNKNQLRLLEIFSLNPYFRFTRNNLMKRIYIKVHINTISNFIKTAEDREWIRKQRIIPGATINNLFMFQKLPDTFEDGEICNDIRATYYKVTKLGKEVFEINEKMSML